MIWSDEKDNNKKGQTFALIWEGAQSEMVGNLIENMNNGNNKWINNKTHTHRNVEIYVVRNNVCNIVLSVLKMRCIYTYLETTQCRNLKIIVQGYYLFCIYLVIL